MKTVIKVKAGKAFIEMVKQEKAANKERFKKLFAMITPKMISELKKKK